MSNTPAPFRFPKHILPEQRLEYSLGIIERYRLELRPLRQDLSRKSRQVEQLKKKLERVEEEGKQVKAENLELQKEIKKLSKELEKTKKTKNRYQVSLFDKGNFKKETKSGKQKGGQPGHADTNLPPDRRYSRR